MRPIYFRKFKQWVICFNLLVELVRRFYHCFILGNFQRVATETQYWMGNVFLRKLTSLQLRRPLLYFIVKPARKVASTQEGTLTSRTRGCFDRALTTNFKCDQKIRSGPSAEITIWLAKSKTLWAFNGEMFPFNQTSFMGKRCLDDE